MDKKQARLIAIKCMEEARRSFSQPKESWFSKRTQEEQNILNDGIKEIDEALMIIKSDD